MMMLSAWVTVIIYVTTIHIIIIIIVNITFIIIIIIIIISRCINDDVERKWLGSFDLPLCHWAATTWRGVMSGNEQKQKMNKKRGKKTFLTLFNPEDSLGNLILNPFLSK